jgi:hypothetical protein
MQRLYDLGNHNYYGMIDRFGWKNTKTRAPASTDRGSVTRAIY